MPHSDFRAENVLLKEMVEKQETASVFGLRQSLIIVCELISDKMISDKMISDR